MNDKNALPSIGLSLEGEGAMQQVLDMIRAGGLFASLDIDVEKPPGTADQGYRDD